MTRLQRLAVFGRRPRSLSHRIGMVFLAAILVASCDLGFSGPIDFDFDFDLGLDFSLFPGQGCAGTPGERGRIVFHFGQDFRDWSQPGEAFAVGTTARIRMDSTTRQALPDLLLQSTEVDVIQVEDTGRDTFPFRASFLRPGTAILRASEPGGPDPRGYDQVTIRVAEPAGFSFVSSHFLIRVPRTIHPETGSTGVVLAPGARFKLYTQLIDAGGRGLGGEYEASVVPSPLATAELPGLPVRWALTYLETWLTGDATGQDLITVLGPRGLSSALPLEVTDTPSIDTVELIASPDGHGVGVGDSVTLVATAQTTDGRVSYGHHTDFWSSDPEVALVQVDPEHADAAVVTFVSPGSATVYASVPGKPADFYEFTVF